MANRLPRSTPSPGKRGKRRLCHRRDVEDVEIRSAELDACHLLLTGMSMTWSTLPSGA